MSMENINSQPEGLVAIFAEMARQHRDALVSFEAAHERAREVAQALRSSGRLLLLGMGGSHALGRAVVPLYRDPGIDAIALRSEERRLG